MKKLFAILLAGAIMVGSAACSRSDSGNDRPAGNDQQQTAVTVMEMKGQELVDLMADAEKAANTVVVDVRKADEYNAGHIEGSVNITLEDLEADPDLLDGYQDKTVVLYCNSGNRSGKAGKILVDKGYSTVYNAEGVKQFEYKLVTE
ncbi:MAG: rhodanese-like domain-containing protein [Peptostreptococcaceae bacterium]|nr:rhodanese-like domain-containing protein [Peptostreptococcaceae bacterium]